MLARVKPSPFLSAALVGALVTAPLRAQTLPAGYQFSNMATGLGVTTNIAFLGPGDVFILNKVSGEVKRVQFSTASGAPPPTVTTVLDLNVNANSESGLLGIALPPDFASTGDVFLYYTNASPLQNRIDRFHWNGSTLTFAAEVRPLSGGGGNHNGGIILFGPDGMLYGVIGDLNDNQLTQNNQSSAIVRERGIILRMNRDGSAPADNPFISQPGWERIYGYGVRNSFGMAFDPLTGVLWDTENGPANYDEINRVPPGYNSGWNKIMGPISRSGLTTANLVMRPGAVYVDPMFSWLATIAPTSIVFLHSVRFPASIRDQILVGDNNGQAAHLFAPNAARDGLVLTGDLADLVADTTAERISARWATGLGVVTDLKIGPDGYLYELAINGVLRRIRPQFPPGDINRDGNVDGADISEFVAVLLGADTDPAKITQADFNGSTAADSADVPMFIESLLLPS